ncbi:MULTISPECIES: ABC transporter substrate-binding protein [Paenibacillus]|uniref:ABC transporter substrate-binding protein n=1 Tax=Paenibacillus TaxID=44249 RepID=UPI00087F3E64|nr:MULTISPECIES: ABC transporter substrate-binding protein [Paenibacillus]NTZ19142.1 transporter substrate-binding domain-containing protein [Paenibacillus sp. JMULE4]GCL74083.1 ABC transporter substrate-binding protein [Paenibacillus naphthalenovorans]SDJ34055.1 NitT/TauT family transport system substrate-binding protein [Paenibacillus naphthalenovorans]
MKKAWVMVMVALLCVTAVLAGCGNTGGSGQQTQGTPPENNAGGKPAEQAKPVKLQIGLLKLTSSAPIFIAMEKGYFKEENIEVTPQWFEAAQPIAVATASGSVEVGATGITASLYNMIAGGQKLLIVADKGREQKGYSSSSLLVHKDSQIQSIKDLKGKKIGVTQTGSTFHYMAGRLLEKHGLSLSDVEITPLGKLNAMNDTLKSKQVDAILTAEPNISYILNEGYGKVIANVGDEIDYQISAIFFSQKFADDKDAAVRFMTAYAKAARYYYDAVLVKKDGQPVPGANYDEVIDIIAKYTDQPAELVKQGLPYMDRDGRLLAEDIKTQIDWYFKNKMIEKSIDYKTIVNTELLEEGIKRLGK